MLNILFWLVLGVIIAINRHPSLPVPSQMKAILAGMSIGMAVILSILFFFILRRSHRAYYLSLVFFAMTAFLTIIDEVGYSDIIILILNVLPIILLVTDRKWYLQDRPSVQESIQTPEP